MNPESHRHKPAALSHVFMWPCVAISVPRFSEVFRITDKIADSIVHLTGDERRALKAAALDLWISNSPPDGAFQRLNPARNRNLWSVRLRANIHTEESP